MEEFDKTMLKGSSSLAIFDVSVNPVLEAIANFMEILRHVQISR